MVSDTDTNKAMSILAVLICLKYFVTVSIQSQFNKRPPEDFWAKASDDSQPLVPTDDAISAPTDETESQPFSARERWFRIVQNEMENVPVTLALLIYSAFTPNTSNDVNIAMATIFLFARCMHTICYAYSLQPWRSIAWVFGTIARLGFMVNILYGAFKK